MKSENRKTDDQFDGYQDTVDIPGILLDIEAIPDEAWNYVIGVRPELTVVNPEGEALGPYDDEGRRRPILDAEGNQVGELPPGLAHWCGNRDDAEAFIRKHPSGDCLHVRRVLMILAEAE